MEKHQIHALLVVDDDKRVVGALNIHDLLRARVCLDSGLGTGSGPDQCHDRKLRRLWYASSAVALRRPTCRCPS